MGYASKGNDKLMGIVIEHKQATMPQTLQDWRTRIRTPCVQGMVNRGASISWLSQFPHESEILFGPLTGIEVLGTRIDGSVVVIICDFSVNLTALTLEQVLGKRRKVVKVCAAHNTTSQPTTSQMPHLRAVPAT